MAAECEGGFVEWIWWRLRQNAIIIWFDLARTFSGQIWGQSYVKKDESNNSNVKSLLRKIANQNRKISNRKISIKLYWVSIEKENFSIFPKAKRNTINTNTLTTRKMAQFSHLTNDSEFFRAKLKLISYFSTILGLLIVGNKRKTQWKFTIFLVFYYLSKSFP